MLIFDYHIFAAVAGFIILDIVTGFSQACANKTISSVKMRTGLFHKLAYVLVITLAILCEYATLHAELGFTVPITTPVCTFICFTEIVSIIENLGKLNPELAGSKLLKYFSQNKNRRIDD